MVRVRREEKSGGRSEDNLKKTASEADGDCAGLCDVGFDEPQEFIQVAGGGGKDIGGVFIFCFADRFTHVIGHNRVAVSQLFQVILNVVNIQRVAFQRVLLLIT